MEEIGECMIPTFEEKEKKSSSATQDKLGNIPFPIFNKLIWNEISFGLFGTRQKELDIV